MIKHTSGSVSGLFFTLLLIVPLTVSAQDNGSVSDTVPETPEIELPDMGEEVRALENRDVGAPLAELPPVPLPDEAAPLPEEDILAVPESAFNTETSLDTQARPELGETFSEASIGAWLWDGVSAQISIYRPGTNPAFSMAFSHDSRDGFAFNESGEGFSSRRTAVSGRVRGGENGRWALSASFEDEADGLQGLSEAFYGISHRYLDVQASFKNPLGPLLFLGSMDARSASLSLERTALDMPGDTGTQELSLHPELGLEWSGKRWNFSLKGLYSFQGLLGDPEQVQAEDRFTQRGQADLNALFEYSPALSFAASVGIATSKEQAMLVPFQLETSAGLGQAAALTLSGGLSIYSQSLSSVWKENPYLDIGPVLPEDAYWNASVNLELYPFRDMTLLLGGEWARSLPGSGWLVSSPPEENNPRFLFGYVLEDYEILDTRISLRKRMGPANASLGWQASWMDVHENVARHILSGELEYQEERGRFGAALSCSSGLDEDGLAMPVIDSNAFIRVASGVRIIAELNDISAAFKGQDGRSLWKPYLSEGFQAGLRLQFSL